jgi:DNA (cytosine-5)-methyltransferase 1
LIGLGVKRAYWVGKACSKEKMILTYQDAKPFLAKSLLSVFPQTEKDEIDAIVTHWLQSQNQLVPFLTAPMREHCITALKPSDTRKTVGIELAKASSTAYQYSLPIDWHDIPFPPPKNPSFTFIDLFAGIGGFRIAMQEQGGQCVFSSEWDLSAKKTYEANFGEVPYGDIQKIDERDIPPHDVLCAGFPCQPFSLAGVSARNALNTAHGFACETQGTLFFDVVRIIQEKRPKIVFLENVKNLVRHDEGKTFAVIENTIKSLGYSFSYKLIDASPLVPQKRIRCYMVCIRDEDSKFIFPSVEGSPLALRTILEENVDGAYTISERLWVGHQKRTQINLDRGTGFTAFCADLDKPSNTIVARYGKDGKECLIPQNGKNPRMLTPRECARLQGFPESFIIVTAKTTAYRQFGNSVAVPVIRLIAKEIVNYLHSKQVGDQECDLEKSKVEGLGQNMVHILL